MQVLTVMVEGTHKVTHARTHGCLHLIDLAGSERVGKSGAEGQQLLEAQHINKSLRWAAACCFCCCQGLALPCCCYRSWRLLWASTPAGNSRQQPPDHHSAPLTGTPSPPATCPPSCCSALGNVMHSLASKSPHIPFRDSKLTQLLQDSLSGQAKTMMFMHVAPEVRRRAVHAVRAVVVVMGWGGWYRRLWAAADARATTYLVGPPAPTLPARHSRRCPQTLLTRVEPHLN